MRAAGMLDINQSLKQFYGMGEDQALTTSLSVGQSAPFGPPLLLPVLPVCYCVCGLCAEVSACRRGGGDGHEV
jgi:hypothetical protein